MDEESTTAAGTVRVPVDQPDMFGRHEEYVDAEPDAADGWDSRIWGDLPRDLRR